MSGRVFSLWVLVTIVAQGCGPRGGSDAGTAGDVAPELRVDAPGETPPQLHDLALEPVWGNPLAALLTFTTDEPGTWALTVEEAEGGRRWTVAPDLSPATTHQVPVLGLRASQAYHLGVEVTDGAGNVASEAGLAWQSGPLPDDIPQVTVLASMPEDADPGVTLLNLILWGGDVLNQGLLIAVDGAGEIVWLHRATETLVEARRTQQGTLLVAFGESGGVREIDMLGNVLHEWRPSELGLDGLHHAVGPGPGDSIVSLAPELRWIDGYPRDDGTTTGYWVVGDRAVELPREGPPIRSWSLLDVLDPYHYNPGFFVPFWLLLYPEADGGPKDWSHGNAIQYLPADDSYLISLANQDLLVKLDRDTGALIWSLGAAGDVDLAPGGAWFSVPHGGEWVEGGRVLLYDDGVFKPTRRSRVVEYTLSASEGAGPWTATETWTWDGGDAPFYSMGPADVDALPDGNLLVLHGSLVEDPEASPFSGGNDLWIRLEEIRRAPAGERVFGVDIGGPTDPSVEKVTSFAAERIPGLYPPGWVVELDEAPQESSCAEVCADLDCGWVDGCVCGVCLPGSLCHEGGCADCVETCAALGRVCGLLDISCDCGACPEDHLCDEAGACEDEAILCAPFCEGRECGLVGAFYLGQSCDCGQCPEGQTCDEVSATCT